MTENTPFGPEEIRQLNRNMMEKMLDKAASDPEWKQRLLDDPEAAMMEADFPEVHQLQEMKDSLPQEEEVRGHGSGMQMLHGCPDIDTWVPHTL